MKLPAPPRQPLDAAQRELLLEIVAELRGMIEASVSLNGDQQQLEELAGSLRERRLHMAQLAGNRGLEAYHPRPELLNDFLPTSPVTGRFNPLAPPLQVKQVGERILGEAVLGNAYEGPPGCVHGAIVAALYDQLLAIANVRCGAAGPTAQLNVSYHRPTPLHQLLEFSAWVEEQEGRKITLKGECHVAGERVTSCEALFIRFDG